MLCKINLHKNPGGGVKGVTQQYQAKGTIDTGDFVKLLTDYKSINNSEETQINTDEIISLSAVALSETKVFVTYSIYEGDYIKIYGNVCEINNNIITIGTKTNIAEAPKSTSVISNNVIVNKLNSDKIIISFLSNYNSGNEIYQIVCSINNLEITLGELFNTGVSFAGARYPLLRDWSIKPLTADKLVVAYSAQYTGNNGSTYIGGKIQVLAINNYTISNYAAIELTGDVSYTDYLKMKIAILDTNRILVTYTKRSNNSNLYGMIYTLNGANLSKGTETVISDKNYIKTVITLNSNKVLAIYDSLYVKILNINETTITVGTEMQIDTNGNINNAISAVAIDENSVLLVHGSTIKAKVLKVEGDIITVQSDILLSSETANDYCLSACKLINNKISVMYNRTSNGNAYGFVIDYLNKFVQKIAKETDKIMGVAQKKGTTGDIIPVKVPDFSLKEEN